MMSRTPNGRLCRVEAAQSFPEHRHDSQLSLLVQQPPRKAPGIPSGTILHRSLLCSSCFFFLWVASGASPVAAQEAPKPAASSAAPSPPRAAPAPAPATATAPQTIRKQPQAKTPEEEAAYQAFLKEKDPNARVRLIEDFLLSYPNTELKESTYLAAMQAYQAKNDFNHLLTYGEMVLDENPENLTALLTLAAAISEMTDRNDSDSEEMLREGDQDALKALDVLQRLRKPPGYPEDQWEEARRESESTAHAARGLIALIREDFVRAELELKEAVELTKNPSATLLYRLGMSYSFQKKYSEALEVLDRAASLGGVKIATGNGSTRDLVAEAQEFASKALARTVSSPPEPVAPAEPSAAESSGQAPPSPAP